MIRGKHFAAPEIQSRLESLHKNLSDLKKKTSDRKNKLRDALEAQKVRLTFDSLFILRKSSQETYILS